MRADRGLVHFGSPPGTTYEDPAPDTRPLVHFGAPTGDES